MAFDPAPQDDGALPPVARRVTGLALAAVAFIGALAIAHVRLDAAAFLLVAALGAVALVAMGAWVARATATAFRARTLELRHLADQLSALDEKVDVARRQSLNAMADTIERESGIVMARLAQQIRSTPAGGDGEALVRLAREAIVRAVRSASGDVERRRWPRLRIIGSAEIELAGAHVSAPIIDVSAGGVRIASALDGRAGESCRVRLPGVGPELPARILAAADGEARLQFDIDDITRAVVQRMLERSARARAEAA